MRQKTFDKITELVNTNWVDNFGQQNQNPPVVPVSPIEQTPPIQTPPISSSKSKLPILIIGIILFLLIAGGVAGFYVFKLQTKPVACTMEAKLCPDGTSVGRSGPKCEFTPCPTAKISPTPDPASNAASATANWKTYNNNFGNYSFKLPDTWAPGKENPSTSTLSVIEFNSADYKESQPTSPGMALPTLNSGSSLYIRTETNGNFKTYEDYKYFIENVSTGSFKNKEKEEFLVGGEKCLFFSNTEWFGGFATVCYMQHNNKTYDLVYKTKTKDFSLFKQILSTFKFTEQSLPPGGQYSSEGQSCGPNAGSAGDAQCVPGLTCKYKTPQEQTSGIGTCVKK